MVDTQKKFDVLVAQTVNMDYIGPKVFIKLGEGFNGIPKPTDIDILEFKTKKNAKPVETGGSTTARQEYKKFILPEQLVEYINKLINTGRKLKTLFFDMEFAKSNEDIKNILSMEYEKGFISEKEKNEMFRFLIFSPVQATRKTEDSNQNVQMDIAKRERLDRLKNEHGIIVSYYDYS